MVEQGLKPITQVLHQHVVPANPTVAKYLKLEPETPVIEIARLRSVQGVPIVLVTTYLPYVLCPNLVTDDLNNHPCALYWKAAITSTLAGPPGDSGGAGRRTGGETVRG